MKSAQPVDMKIKITPNKGKAGFPVSYQIMGKKELKPQTKQQSDSSQQSNSASGPKATEPNHTKPIKQKVNSATLNLFDNLKPTNKVIPNTKVKTPLPSDSKVPSQDQRKLKASEHNTVEHVSQYTPE